MQSDSATGLIECITTISLVANILYTIVKLF
jgi:hypothetical protein